MTPTPDDRASQPTASQRADAFPSPAAPAATARADAAEFRAAFEKAPGNFLVLAADAPLFTVAAVTDCYLRTTMTTRDAVVGRPVFAALRDANSAHRGPDGLAGLRKSLETVVRTAAAHRMSEQRADVQRPDGSWEARLWAPVNIPITGPGGEVRFVLHAVEDVTDRTRQREAIALAERRTSQLLDRISDVVMIFDAEWRYRSFNPAGAEMIRRAGADPEAIIGRVIWEAFPELAGTPFERGLREAASAGRSVHVEVTYPVGDGPPMVAEGDAVPTDDGVAVYLRDVSAYRQLLDAERAARANAEATQLAAEWARREADEANHAKSAFLATMSHEIRTPINAVLGYAQLIELGIAGPVTERQRDYLARLAASSEHLLGLVDDVLDLAKIDAGGISVAQDRALTGPTVATALDLVRPQAIAHGVRLVDARPGDPGEPFIGDEHRVRQVLLNVLSNAVKFTASGGTVTIACGRVAEPPADAPLRGTRPWTYVRITDTGVGIPVDQQSLVFEPFHQVEQGHTREKGGTGLGLAISRRLARLMGGDLTLESTPGVGSTFTLWLPAPIDEGRQSGQSAADRGARMRANLTPARIHGLADVGTFLRERVEDVIAAHTARLRNDPALPNAAHLKRSELEDHQLPFLADVAQTLVVIEESGGPESDLLRDGSTIQRVVADLHGTMRHRHGWGVPELSREYEILSDEIAAVVRLAAPSDSGDASVALDVLDRIVERARVIAVAALRRAAESEGRAD
jgi:signal transduction histidine kinase